MAQYRIYIISQRSYAPKKKAEEYTRMLIPYQLRSNYLMQNHGLVCKINKGLWEAESQRAQAGSETPNKNERLHGEPLGSFPP